MKVLICGAGIAGLALAQRMQSHGWDVCVVERVPGPREHGYMLDFIGAGYEAAEAMGVLPRLQRLAYRLEEVAYVDRGGRRRAHLDYRPFARLLNGRLLSIMRPDLERALREELTDRVDLRFGCGVTDIDNCRTGVNVALSDGTRVKADLLVGADGVHSTVRRLAFGPEQQFFRYLGFHVAAYIFDDPQVRSRLHDRFYMTDSTNRVMGLYGLRDGRVATFCVHRAADPTLPADPRAALQHMYASLGWVAPRALDRCPPNSELYYDQVAQVEVPVWRQGRVALVGDACQAVSLLAGQGASLAVAAAYVLGEQLATAESIDVALANYQRVWRPVVAEKQRAGRRGAQWFLPNTTAQLWMRRLMFAAASLPVLNTVVGYELLGESTIRVRDLAHAAPESLHGHGPRAMFTRSPSTLMRVCFSAPAWLYRLGLGRIFGHRLLLLTHRGRKSGGTYRSVLEVVSYNPATRESVVCSGWGTRADWYRNIVASGPIAVETGGDSFGSPSFRALRPEENYPIVTEYVRRLPTRLRPLAYRLGLDVRGSEEERRAHSRTLLMVAFGPHVAPTSDTDAALLPESLPVGNS